MSFRTTQVLSPSFNASHQIWNVCSTVLYNHRSELLQRWDSISIDLPRPKYNRLSTRGIKELKVPVKASTTHVDLQPFEYLRFVLALSLSNSCVLDLSGVVYKTQVHQGLPSACLTLSIRKAYSFILLFCI